MYIYKMNNQNGINLTNSFFDVFNEYKMILHLHYEQGSHIVNNTNFSYIKEEELIKVYEKLNICK